MHRPEPQLTPLRAQAHLTFKGNLRETRYGWLRLTPAYSVHLVAELLSADIKDGGRVLDPFCGTGTTALVCAEAGIPCDTTDINPFLLWLTRAKTRPYTSDEIAAFTSGALEVEQAIQSSWEAWTPPLHQIEKWWDEDTLRALARAMERIEAISPSIGTAVGDLLRVAFCRSMISVANVSFGHQSMSFKKRRADVALFEHDVSGSASVTAQWRAAAAQVAQGAASSILQEPSPVLCDARELTTAFEPESYVSVITSPPYPNRMSYIRELRPYMYWLRYLTDARSAGEMDWQAIGGTWGVATSNVGKWQPPTEGEVTFDGFSTLVADIAKTSDLLARYVHKYFYDIRHHCKELATVLRSGGHVHYIVGNSKFYDVLLPVEEIYAALLRDVGLANVEVRAIRKRSSKKELFEYIVSAMKP